MRSLLQNLRLTVSLEKIVGKLKELYEELPDPKPSFEEAWMLTGGNPEMLARLRQANWDVDEVVARLIKMKRLRDLARKWKPYLKEAVEDPDSVYEKDHPEEFKKELIINNLIVYDMYDRDLKLWIDQPPPERDVETGIGKYVAWQTPLHREAVRRAMA